MPNPLSFNAIVTGQRCRDTGAPESCGALGYQRFHESKIAVNSTLNVLCSSLLCDSELFVIVVMCLLVVVCVA